MYKNEFEAGYCEAIDEVLKLKRYSCETNPYDDNSPIMEEDEKGDFVKVKDVEKLKDGNRI